MNQWGEARSLVGLIRNTSANMEIYPHEKIEPPTLLFLWNLIYFLMHNKMHPRPPCVLPLALIGYLLVVPIFFKFKDFFKWLNIDIKLKKYIQYWYSRHFWGLMALVWDYHWEGGYQLVTNAKLNKRHIGWPEKAKGLWTGGGSRWGREVSY